jgi:dual specificity tyrosine-phosphorylation-regulated kinase 1
MHRNHQCLVFEMMSLNLYQVLHKTQFRGVSLHVIRDFAVQVLQSLAFLAREDVDIIHCDLKPENILLRRHATKKNEVKVIDFGSSCRADKRVYPYIQSRYYRSPEVLLGLPYTAAIDMWSLACTMVEMHTGTPLFSGSDQFEQVQQIVKVLGMVPDRMLDKVTDEVAFRYFEQNEDDGTWHLRQTKQPLASFTASSAAAATMMVLPTAAAFAASPLPMAQVPAASPIIVPSLNPIASLTRAIMSPGLGCRYPTDPSNSQHNYTPFIDLISKMLAYDPRERIKPAAALQHPFFTLEANAASTATATTTSTTMSTTVASENPPKRRKMDRLAAASNLEKQQEEVDADEKHHQQQQPVLVPTREPSILERLRRVFG